MEHSGEMAQSPKDRVMQYIQYRDLSRESGKIHKKELKQVGSEFPVKGIWKETEVAMATAFERTYDRLDDNAAKRALDTMRPTIYDMARIYRYAAGVGELVLGWKVLTHEYTYTKNALGTGWLGGSIKHGALAIAGVGATAVFRPVEWAATRLADVAGVIGSEAVAPIVNNIFKGGEPRQEMPKPTPA